MLTFNTSQLTGNLLRTGKVRHERTLFKSHIHRMIVQSDLVSKYVINIKTLYIYGTFLSNMSFRCLSMLFMLLLDTEDLDNI